MPTPVPVAATPPRLVEGFSFQGEHTVASGWRIQMTRATFGAPDGSTFTRDVVRHPGAVAVVPVTDTGMVLMVEQYRGPIDRLLLEIPAGTRDVAGEPPEQTARRELAEEVGVHAGHLQHLCTFYNSPGFCDEETVLYLATGLTPCPTGRSGVEEEHMTVRPVDLGSVEELVVNGILQDGQSILGLLLARDRLSTGGADVQGISPARRS